MNDFDNPDTSNYRIEKESPCYGLNSRGFEVTWKGNVRRRFDSSGKIILHEFAGGECVFCGFPQPGSDKARRMKPLLP